MVGRGLTSSCGCRSARWCGTTRAAHSSATCAEPGEEHWLRLELKLLADVGLLGFPNVGKSTFIARVSRARPKIADYPFTTLTPHLGVVQLSDGRSFVLADVPGLIAGAADGGSSSTWSRSARIRSAIRSAITT